MQLEEWARQWMLPILDPNRLSNNVEDRRGESPSRLPQFSPSPWGVAPHPYGSSWEPSVNHEEQLPDRTQGMLPPLGDFLAGKVDTSNLPQAEMMRLTPEYIERVKKYEGYNPRAYPDYKQYSIGYGTRARQPGETINREEAERRLIEELTRPEQSVQRMGIPMSPSQQDALTDITYNAGPGWQNWALGRAVKAGDWQTAAEIYRRTATTVNNGQQVLQGLINRRAGEAPGLLNQQGTAPMTPTTPFFQGDPSQAPQGVSVGQSLQPNPLAPQPAPPGTPPQAIKQAWTNYFQAPEIQGALINMAIEMMRPRWNPGSMLPDALNAGLRTIGGQEAYEDKLFKEQAAQHNKDLDRESLERRTEMAADSRLEVAEARIAGQLAGIQERNRLKSTTLSPSEQIRFGNLIAKFEKQIRDQNEAAFFRGSKEGIVPEDQIEAMARRKAHEAIVLGRLAFGGDAPNSADVDGPGPAAPSGPGGSQGDSKQRSQAAPEAGKTKAPKRSLADIKAEAEQKLGPGGFSRLLTTPAYRNRLSEMLNPADLQKLERELQGLR